MMSMSQNGKGNGIQQVLEKCLGHLQKDESRHMEAIERLQMKMKQIKTQLEEHKMQEKEAEKAQAGFANNSVSLVIIMAFYPP